MTKYTQPKAGFTEGCFKGSKGVLNEEEIERFGQERGSLPERGCPHSASVGEWNLAEGMEQR